MNKKNSYNILFMLAIIIILVFISIFSEISYSQKSQIYIDDEDGLYYLDIFEENINVELTNCVTSSRNNKIILDPHGTNIGIYDFSNWSDQSENRAYEYETPYFLYFFPPDLHISLLENELSYLNEGISREGFFSLT